MTKINTIHCVTAEVFRIYLFLIQVLRGFFGSVLASYTDPLIADGKQDTDCMYHLLNYLTVLMLIDEVLRVIQVNDVCNG
jgi:hypothetical protein